MVTSQGQVVTQAIPQGAIQIQNTQVSVCTPRCVHLCMDTGEGSRNCLLCAGRFTQVSHLILIILPRGISYPQVPDQKPGV